MKPSFWLRRNFVFKAPMAIVTIPERGHGGAHLLQVAEEATVDHLLLQRPVETLGYTIGLRLGDKGEARRNTPELDRVEEIIGGVLHAVVHAQNQLASGIGAGGAKLCLEALGDRLQGREAVADLDCISVALRAPSAEPSATPPIFDSFSIPSSFLLIRFYPKFVSRKIWASAVKIDQIRSTPHGSIRPRHAMPRQRR